jgi:hypothetical protein
MDIDIDRKILSSTEEKLEIKILWNPQNEEEDAIVAMAFSVIEFIKRYNRLNTLTGD